ncbi:MAG: CDP-alcohol phosphatidyltransferase family protein [Actinomycetota bacterium]|nr:CDP-alcohol phosphatidyltransferase family protein [Actinomycetota bacterium]
MVEERSNTGSAEEEVHHNIYSVANLITALRLLLIPFFFAILIRDTERARLTAFTIYAIAASTDWIDGQIARRTHTVTSIGKIIDPLVDRLLLASGVVGLYIIGELPAWIPVVLVLRDVYLLYGSYVMERHHTILPVTYIGKVTTAVLLVGFSSLIAGWPVVGGLGVVDLSWLPGLGEARASLGIWFVYVGVVLSLITAVGYTFRASRALEQVTASERQASAR